MKIKKNQNPYFGIAPSLRLKPVQNLHIMYTSHDRMLAASSVPYIMLQEVAGGIK
jgi:hypothetical protein